MRKKFHPVFVNLWEIQVVNVSMGRNIFFMIIRFSHSKSISKPRDSWIGGWEEGVIGKINCIYYWLNCVKNTTNQKDLPTAKYVFQYRNINISKIFPNAKYTNAEMFPAFKITNNEIIQQRILPILKHYQKRKIANTEILRIWKHNKKRKITNIEILPILKHYQKRKIISSEISPSTKCHQPRNITWIWQPFSKSTFPTVNLKSRSIAKYKKKLVFICRVNSKINI